MILWPSDKSCHKHIGAFVRELGRDAETLQVYGQGKAQQLLRLGFTSALALYGGAAKHDKTVEATRALQHGLAGAHLSWWQKVLLKRKDQR